MSSQEQPENEQSKPTAVESASTASDLTGSSTYKHLVEQYELNDQLAERLTQLIDSQKLTLEQLDETTIETLRSIQHVPAALNALAEFERLHENPIEEEDPNLPSLIELMEKLQTDDSQSVDDKRSASVADSDHIARNSSETGSRSVTGLQFGPDEAKLKEILARTGTIALMRHGVKIETNLICFSLKFNAIRL
jgi:hypothetical protein